MRSFRLVGDVGIVIVRDCTCERHTLSGLGKISATAPRNTHCAYSPAAILAGYVVKCVIEKSQRAPREL